MNLHAKAVWTLLIPLSAGAAMVTVGACHGQAASPQAASPQATSPEVTPADVPAPPPRSPAAHHGQDRTLHMQIHFWAAIDARDGLIGADIESARRSLAWLAEHQRPESMPGRSRTWLAPMRQAAAQAANAEDAGEVAIGIARVAQRCGECHMAMDIAIEGSPEEEDQGVPPIGPEYMEDRMGRHAWSVDELWAGLVFPSETAWTRGVQVLAKMPSDPPRLGPEPPPPEFVRDLERVRALGERAGDATTGDERAQVLADLLSSCQQCHR